MLENLLYIIIMNNSMKSPHLTKEERILQRVHKDVFALDTRSTKKNSKLLKEIGKDVNWLDKHNKSKHVEEHSGLETWGGAGI